ncbi:hypothetical protein Y032_0519g2836 [Ancylostoma ceylanicum]|uniref:Uncharacterized protein n=1 Tax=Ancylostoma ceylanicum TaxID=53326 RepID=A0A016WT38_9BILA|nr:hypothetical protein Y032_0519g2836 [Ancylostoma ceylanicum]
MTSSLSQQQEGLRLLLRLLVLSFVPTSFHLSYSLGAIRFDRAFAVTAALLPPEHAARKKQAIRRHIDRQSAIEPTASRDPMSVELLSRQTHCRKESIACAAFSSLRWESSENGCIRLSNVAILKHPRYKAVTSKCIDFVPLAPVAFTWIMELHAIIYSIAIDDFYMLLANTIFFCMDGSLLAMFFIFPNDRPHFKVEISVQ